jgi:hypothetical protein
MLAIIERLMNNLTPKEFHRTDPEPGLRGLISGLILCVKKQRTRCHPEIEPALSLSKGARFCVFIVH